MKKALFLVLLLILALHFNAQNSKSKTNSKYYKPNAAKVAEEKKKQEEAAKAAATKKATSKTATTSKSGSKTTATKEEPKAADPNAIESSWAIALDGRMVSTSADATTNRTGIFGMMSLQRVIKGKFYFGLYGQTMFHLNSDDVSALAGQVVEMSSSEMNTVGINFGFDLMSKSAIFLAPEVRAGYNIYNVKGLSFPTDKNAFVNYQFITVNPMLNLGVKITKNFVWGLNAGYMLPITYIKGAEDKEFAPKALNFGTFFRYNIR
jgi:hypothetical protein